jgi:two-component system sensor histidine kinase KdpD
MRSYLPAILVVVLCTAVNWALSLWLAPTNLAMVYVLGVVAVAARYERGPAMTCALLSALAFDFLFVPPVFTLRIDDTQYVVTGLALVVVGIVISTLASRARAATRASLLAQEEQLRNSLLASLSHDLRTPLAVIAGSASSLRDERERLSQAEQDQLLETLYDEAQHVSLTVNDLLEMTRLHAGRVVLDRQWYPAEELIGAQDAIVAYDDGSGARTLGTVQAGRTDRFIIAAPRAMSVSISARSTTGSRTWGPFPLELAAGETRSVTIR